jgi:hypothetical protein
MKARSEIAGILTKREIEDLGAPWLAMAEAPAQDNYRTAPPSSYGVVPPNPAYGGDANSPLSLEGFGEVSANPTDKINRLNPYLGMRLRYGRSF